MPQNFIEILDRLPKNQQQPFIDHFVSMLLGKEVEPLIMPKNFTIANDGTLEERIAFVASLYNIDPQLIDREEFRLLEEEVENSRRLVAEIIKDNYGKDQGGQRNKNDELLSLGKFLYTVGYDYKIQQTEKPDFLLTDSTKQIGLEHTRLDYQKDREFFAELWNKYIKKSLAMVLADQPTLTGIVNLILDTDLHIEEGKSLKDFKAPAIRKNIPAIQRSLADYIISGISGAPGEKPVFIKQFSYQAGKDSLTIRPSQEFFQRNDFEDMLNTYVQNKEPNLLTYKQERNSSCDEWWLLVVYDGVNYSSSFRTDNLAINKPIYSSFDRVFILNSFTLACFELQKEKPYIRSVATKEYRTLKISRTPL